MVGGTVRPALGERVGKKWGLSPRLGGGVRAQDSGGAGEEGRKHQVSQRKPVGSLRSFASAAAPRWVWVGAFPGPVLGDSCGCRQCSRGSWGGVCVGVRV